MSLQSKMFYLMYLCKIPSVEKKKSDNQLSP